jgi:hypothetical protein
MPILSNLPLTGHQAAGSQNACWMAGSRRRRFGNAVGLGRREPPFARHCPPLRLLFAPVSRRRLDCRRWR